MRAPRFWGNPPDRPGALARLLAPLAWLWAAVDAAAAGARAGGAGRGAGDLRRQPDRRRRRQDADGGGAGRCGSAARGVAAHVVSRGHGGRLAGPVRVDPARHRAADVGDEPLLLAAFAPVWVGRDRAAAARAAAAAGARAVVMDDGFQNPGLAKDLSIVVVDAGYGFGNGRVMPAGPLREPVADGLARADLVLAIGPAGGAARGSPAAGRAARPLVEGALVPLATGMDWRGLRAVAFAGIGRPEKFFATLRAAGAEIVAAHGFGDHEPFDRAHPRPARGRGDGGAGAARHHREGRGAAAAGVPAEGAGAAGAAGARGLGAGRRGAAPTRAGVISMAANDEREDAMGARSETLERTALPIDAGRLDELMEAAGIDVLLATSKHNVRYLLGGYRFLFFSTMEAIGHSRYLPVLLYRRGHPEQAAYVGYGMERYENANYPFWTPRFRPGAAGTLGAAAMAADELGTDRLRRGADRHRAGIPAERRPCGCSATGWRGRGSSTRPACSSGCGR